MEQIKWANSLREALIPLSTFSRSAFGVGLTLLSGREDPGRCSCALFAAGESEPEMCPRFRESLFDEETALLASCPAGLTLAALPVRTGEERKVVLLVRA